MNKMLITILESKDVDITNDVCLSARIFHSLYEQNPDAVIIPVGRNVDVSQVKKETGIALTVEENRFHRGYITLILKGDNNNEM